MRVATDEAVEIPLRTRGTPMVAIVDASDVDLLMRWPWYPTKSRRTYYAGRGRDGPPGEATQMHRLLCGLAGDDPRRVDHIDTNGLNNRRSNLRVVTHKQNSWRFFRTPGKSGYRGVYWSASSRKWTVLVRVGKERIRLGLYQSAKEAADAYDAFVVSLRGEFAVTNAMLVGSANHP